MIKMVLNVHVVEVTNSFYGTFKIGAICHETEKAILIRGGHTTELSDNAPRGYLFYREHWIPKKSIIVKEKIGELDGTFTKLCQHCGDLMVWMSRRKIWSCDCIEGEE